MPPESSMVTLSRIPACSSSWRVIGRCRLSCYREAEYLRRHAQPQVRHRQSPPRPQFSRYMLAAFPRRIASWIGTRTRWLSLISTPNSLGPLPVRIAATKSHGFFIQRPQARTGFEGATRQRGFSAFASATNVLVCVCNAAHPAGCWYVRSTSRIFRASPEERERSTSLACSTGETSQVSCVTSTLKWEKSAAASRDLPRIPSCSEPRRGR